MQYQVTYKYLTDKLEIRNKAIVVEAKDVDEAKKKALERLKDAPGVRLSQVTVY